MTISLTVVLAAHLLLFVAQHHIVNSEPVLLPGDKKLQRFADHLSNIPFLSRDIKADGSGTLPACSQKEAATYINSILSKCAGCATEGEECPESCCAGGFEGEEQFLVCEIGKCCIRVIGVMPTNRLFAASSFSVTKSDGKGVCNEIYVHSNCTDQCAIVLDGNNNYASCPNGVTFPPYKDDVTPVDGCKTVRKGENKTDHTQSDETNKKFPVAPVIGGVLGVIAAIALIALATMFAMQRRRRGPSGHDKIPSPPSTTYYDTDQIAPETSPENTSGMYSTVGESSIHQSTADPLPNASNTSPPSLHSDQPAQGEDPLQKTDAGIYRLGT